MAVGTIAANVAVAVASSLIVSLITPSKGVSGSSRDREAEVPKSEFGGAIWEFYGVVRRNSCPLIWADKLDKIVEEKDVGKGGGGGEGAKETTFLMDAAWLIGSPIKEVHRIWLNSKLMYSKFDSSEENQNFYDNHLEIYDGTQTTPDPTIVDHEGSDVPSFTGRSYIVIRDLDTREFNGGTSLPKVDIEAKGVKSNDNPTVSLETIFDDILKKSGLDSSEFDISDISVDKRINGFPFKNDGIKYREILEELMEYFQIVSFDSNGIKYFKFMNNSQTPIEIPNGALGAKEVNENQKEIFKEKFVNKNEIPSKLEMNYKNINNNHDQGHQEIYNPIQQDRNPKTIDTDMVLNDPYVLALLSNMLKQTQTQKIKYEFTVTPDYALKPSDKIKLPIRQYQEKAEVKSVTLNANFSLDVEAVLYGHRTIRNSPTTVNINYGKYDVNYGDSQTYDSTSDSPNYELVNVSSDNSIFDETNKNDVDGVSYNDNKQVKKYNKATTRQMDIDLLRDTDVENGIYIAVEVDSPWDSGVTYMSVGDESNYKPKVQFNKPSVTGETVTGTLDSGYSLGERDSSSVIEVELFSGKNEGLKNVTESELKLGKQVALIGNEVVSFKNANEISTNKYELSEFIRGFRGWNVPVHGIPERFILLTSHIQRIPTTLDMIGEVLYFKTVHFGQPLSAVNSTSVIFEGNSLKPAPVKSIIALKDEIGNVKFIWQGQDRLGGNNTGEAHDRYEIDITDASTGSIVSTLEAGPDNSDFRSIVYSTNQQQNDGISDINDIEPTFYKMSTVVGRGYPVTKPAPLSFSLNSGSLIDNKNFLGVPNPQKDKRLVSDFSTGNHLQDGMILAEQNTFYYKLNLRDLMKNNWLFD